MSYFDQEDENNEDIEIENAENDDEDIYESEDVQVLAPRIMADQQDRQHWQAEMAGGGLIATTAEGALGKILRKQARSSRTPLERFQENVNRVSREAEISYDVRDAVRILAASGRIPDIGFKSAAGMLFGFMALQVLGKSRSDNPLTPIQTREMDNIMKKVKLVKKDLRVSDLDLIRYVNLLRRIGV